MKNNKGYYSWIHSMKLASIEARNKGFAMKNLNEAKKNLQVIKGEDDDQGMSLSIGTGSLPNQSTKTRTDIQLSNTRRPYSLEDFAAIEMDDRQAGRETQSAQYMYAQYLKALQDRTPDLVPSEIDLSGNKKLDPEDTVLKNTSWATAVSGIPSETKGIYDPPLTTIPTYSLADQARQEHIRKSWQEKHRAQRIAARQKETLADREASVEAQEEGIQGIINRIMRGKN